MRFDEESQLHHLTDHECEHGAFPDDEIPRCHCWDSLALAIRLDALLAAEPVEVVA
jgi:hypothetical protein